MPRPKKQGMEYFTIDVNFYQDIKIRKLIRYKGIQAVSVYHILLCQIYTNGYYMLWDEDIPFTVSEIAHIEEDYVKDVIDYCFNIELLDKTLFEQANVLTSRGIQKRFFDFCVVAKRRLPNDLPYRMVDDKEISVISEETQVISEETQVIPEISPDKTEKTTKKAEISTQSKVKERKDNPTMCGYPRPHTHEEKSQGVGTDDMQVCADIDSEISEMRRSPIWKEHVFMRFKFLGANDQMFNEYLERWAGEVKVSCKHHENLGDAKHHFCNGMIIQEKVLNNNVRNNGTDNNNGYRTVEDLRSGSASIIARMEAAGRRSPK